MHNILYEASFEIEHFVDFETIALMIFILVFPKIWKRFNVYYRKAINYESVKKFCIFCFIFVFVISAIACLGQIHMYKKTVGAYKNGDFEIVEGYVENFAPMAYTGHGDESFLINGVQFSYSDFAIQTGYNNSKSHGGVIEGDGQHLKIGYVYYNESYGNYIEKLE